ncbi:MAG: hypothetical protein EBU49_11425, partial [Proteobacteria bacterium]|nr:hypothetical protein [Pseudomonadota bacterium]
MIKTGSGSHLSKVVYLAITLSIFSLSCGKSVQVQRQSERQSAQPGDGNATSFNLSAGIPSVCHEVPDQPITSEGISGIIAIMQKSVLDASQSKRTVCLQCRPRELMRTKCFDVDVGPLETVCRHNE